MRRERYTKMHWEEFKIPDSCLDSVVDYGLAVPYWVLHTCHKLEMRETVKDLVRNLGPGVEIMYITSVYIPYRTQSYGLIQLQEGLRNVVAQYAQKEIGLN